MRRDTVMLRQIPIVPMAAAFLFFTSISTAQDAKTDTVEAQSPPEAGETPPPPVEPKLVKERRIKHLITFSYDMAVAVGSTWDFVGKFSGQGITFDYLYHLTPHIALGGLTGWNDFGIKERGTYTNGSATLSGTQIRRLDAWYLTGSFRYNFLPIDKKVSPFLGLNMGLYRLWRGTHYGWWQVSSEDWHFGFAPELGVNINFKNVLLQVGTKFHWAVRTSDSDGETWVTFNIGIGVPIY